MNCFRLSGCCLFTLLVFVLTACGGGGGGGSGNTRPIYTGLTTPAAINQANAREITTTAFQGGGFGSSGAGLLGTAADITNTASQTQFSEVVRIINRTIRKVRNHSDSGNSLTGVKFKDSTDGSCGGTAEISGNYTDPFGSYDATVVFSNFCDSGITLNGTIVDTGADTEDGSETGTVEYSSLTIILCEDSFSMVGKNDYSYDAGTDIDTGTYNVLIRDNRSGKVARYKDYNIQTNNTDNSITHTGRYFHPDYGYVDISTTTPLQYSGNLWPDSGVLMYRGAVTAGVSTASQARLTFMANDAYLLEVDKQGDGLFEWSYSDTWPEPGLCAAADGTLTLGNSKSGSVTDGGYYSYLFIPPVDRSYTISLATVASSSDLDWTLLDNQLNKVMQCANDLPNGNEICDTPVLAKDKEYLVVVSSYDGASGYTIVIE